MDAHRPVEAPGGKGLRADPGMDLPLGMALRPALTSSCAKTTHSRAAAVMAVRRVFRSRLAGRRAEMRRDRGIKARVVLCSDARACRAA